MKHWIVFSFLFLIILCSCRGKNAVTVAAPVDETPAVVVDPSVIIGSYVGMFGDNKITILITRVSGDTIAGRSIVGGNDRPFIGPMTLDHSTYNAIAKEPGDDKDDGVFNFSIDSKVQNLLNGNWKPNVPTETLKEKNFTLQKRTFVYRDDVGDYPYASQTLLAVDDVNNLDKDDLEIMRNEIFARHGYCFKKKELRQLFEDKDWYIPYTTDVRNVLTDVEKKNVALIKKYEQYADQYGDDFGR